MLLALASAPCIHKVEIKHPQDTETALLLLFLEKCNLNKKYREVKKKRGIRAGGTGGLCH